MKGVCPPYVLCLRRPACGPFFPFHAAPAAGEWYRSGLSGVLCRGIRPLRGRSLGRRAFLALPGFVSAAARVPAGPFFDACRGAALPDHPGLRQRGAAGRLSGCYGVPSAGTAVPGTASPGALAVLHPPGPGRSVCPPPGAGVGCPAYPAPGSFAAVGGAVRLFGLEFQRGESPSCRGWCRSPGP